jgi:lycopene cyclase domain-containing protein
VDRALYLLLLLVFAGVPIAIAWLARPTALRRGARVSLAVLGIGTVIGWAWDLCAVRDGVWSYADGLDVAVAGLPVEEHAFIVLCTLSITAMTLALMERPGGR